ncbi:putative polygalacturonase At3g15720 [Apium graveolens]|uniref:putative polygalacturonase At3g15720 n=1 Tax=Apium graveolens TaxID=4045 RepID=UPI003D7B9008
MKAWKAACQGKSFDSTLIIPQNKTFLLKPLQFSGPCKSPNIYLKLSGTIVAPNNKLEWTGYHINAWLTFSYINGLVITGDGQIDGQGSAWWSQPCLQDLHTGRTCKGPSALVFHSCNGLRLSGLTHSNSPRVHIILTNCYDAVLSNLRITAPETSPNTDGINVSGSKNVTVKNSYIGTGDDCIAVSGGSSFVNITGISCGPGHGISIGALGKGGHDEVEEIHVRNCTLQGTLTGVRVKSWQTSAVELSDIRYKSIVGTSGTDQVINLSCSRSHGCTNIRIERVYIRSMTPGKRINANCINAHGTWSHTIPDVKCLLP